MVVPVLQSSNRDLDYLLDQVAESVQLTTTQYDRATGHYLAVAEWLSAEGSTLACFQPWIYPQGSAALGTTVKPRGSDEHDVDLVCQLLMVGVPALQVYDLLYRRLIEHGTYRTMLKKMNRCLRLNYRGDFHLDLIPAVPDTSRGGTAVWVPDRELRAWTPSNPKGFVRWFWQMSQTGPLMAKLATEPLPEQSPVAEKTTLAVAVQLMKRRRDLMFPDPDNAPRSILLTTLAGKHYLGGDSLATAVLEIVTGIDREIQEKLPYWIEVPNPTNDGEKFCESFTAERYDAFRYFVRSMQREMQALLVTQGIPELQKALIAMFGEEPTAAAVKAYGARLKAQRDHGTLRFSGAGKGALGIVPGVTGGSPVPKNSYFGD